MLTCYRCEHFVIEELLPRDIINSVRRLPLHQDLIEHILWSMIDEEAKMAIDWLKDTYSPNSPVTINNWKWGGSREHSGVRSTSSPYYRRGSMHSVAMAFDLVFKNITAEEIREDLRNKDYVPYIRRVENKVSWLHIDTKPTTLDTGKVYFFNP